jgi:vacuolar protein sorting-associated protein 18
MALDPSNGYVAASKLQDLEQNALPIFNVERVQLQFSIASDFVAAQVANNVLILALSNGIDLDNPADIDGMSVCWA